MHIYESGENYIEAIYMLGKELGNVRSIDIANKFGYAKSTISVAMKHFRENGFINIDDNGFITLTDKGREIALRVYERHEIIARILIHIGVDEETAYEDSCKIEHDLSDKSFAMIKKYYNDRIN